MSISTIIDRVAERILGSPIAVQVERELSEERLAARQVSADAAARNRAMLLEENQQHAQQLAAIDREIDAIQQQLDRARARRGNAEVGHLERAWTFQQAIERHECELSRSVSPLISEFSTWLWWEIDITLGNRRWVDTKMQDGKRHVRWSNSASISKRVHAIREAINTVGLLALEPIDDEMLTQRIAALRDALPPVEPVPSELLTLWEAEEQRAREGRAFSYR